MPLARIFKSTPLRLAIAFALLFLASFLIAGIAAYEAMKQELGGRLDRQITETFVALEGLYEKNDTTDLISALDRLASATTEHDRVYAVESAAGTLLAGNIATLPKEQGWADLDAPVLGIPEADLQFRMYTAPIGDMLVTVGASLEASSEILEIALSTFVWAAIAVFCLAIGAGCFLALQAQRRIAAIASVMNAIGEGELDSRIKITRKGDDLDHLSIQINTALERLKRLVEGMRQVSSDIAHDLKTPINRLCIAIENVLDGIQAGKPHMNELLEARSDAMQINETFDALLRIAQIEAGARRARFTHIDLKSVIDTVVDAYEPDNGAYTLSFNPKVSGPLEIFGDRELLLQMFANLMDNAIHHSPSPLKICVELWPPTTDAGPIVAISDSGPGIPGEEREKVFQRLYRLEKSRTTSGSGLGLTLVKAIAELHWAEIELRDNDPGLRILIRFPLAAIARSDSSR